MLACRSIPRWWIGTGGTFVTFGSDLRTYVSTTEVRRLYRMALSLVGPQLKERLMKRQYILWYTAALVAAVIGAVAWASRSRQFCCRSCYWPAR